MTRLWMSNRYEVLADRLVEALGGPRASLFTAEQVIVPSAALQRDLSLRIADRHGVCAQVDFSFLAQWLWRQIGRHLPQVGADSPFAPPVLAWRLDRLLADPALARGHPRLAAYLGASDPVMRFGFAGRLAGLYDHLITYRSDWLARWADGASAAPPGRSLPASWRADEAWQAALWRRLLDDLHIAGAHPAQQFLDALGRSRAMCDNDGPVHLFCLPAIPPLYLDVLRQLGRHADLRLYLLNPCREYWYDLVAPKRLSHLAVRGLAEHAEVGHPLLAGWAGQTQAQIDLLLDSDAAGHDDLGSGALLDEAEFVEPSAEHLLARLQASLLDGLAPAPGSLPLEPGDRSIEVHVCHSLTRELEVLHDHLLGLFAHSANAVGDGLQPQDILVVTPDLDAAAPLIDAVFGTAPPERHIPFAVTGRPRRTVNRCARALRELIALLASTAPASAVYELLQQAPVARRFGLDGAALERVAEWFGEAGFRWGLGDAASHRHHLAAGLQRLFLAHVLPTRVDEPFDGELPGGSVEGSEALWLGALWRFAQQLQAWQAAFERAHTPAAWHALLLDTLDGLLQPDTDEAEELRELQASLQQLAEQMAGGGTTRPIEPAVLRSALDALLDEPARGGVPTGRVSFAAMSSLRALPFRVVCVIGLNDGAYPSASRPLEFDLMSALPRRGDRQRRHDERNVFLDLLLAARDSLYLSHTGRSVRDNSPLPPSVLVSELLELLLPATAAAPGDAAALGAARRRLVVDHPLQAFSPRAFATVGDPRLRSFRQDYAEALQHRHGPTAARHRPVAEVDDAEDLSDADELLPDEPGLAFFDAPLPPPGEAWRSPEIPTLVRFFQQPCRALLQQRLGLSLPRAEDGIADDEVFAPDFGGRDALVAQVLPAALAGADAPRLQALAAALVPQPDGSLGAAWRREELARLQRYADGLRADLSAPVLPPWHGHWTIELDGENWQLGARFDHLRPGGLVQHRYDDARVRDHLQAWCWHLALCAAAPPGVAPVSRWHARDGVFRFEPCAEPLAELARLLRLYRDGLRAPLHFFPKSAWAYVDKGGSITAAHGAWQVSRQRPHGEAGDPAYRLALRGVAQPLDAAFEACADAVLGPLRAHLVAPGTPGQGGWS